MAAATFIFVNWYRQSYIYHILMYKANEITLYTNEYNLISHLPNEIWLSNYRIITKWTDVSIFIRETHILLVYNSSPVVEDEH
jgi:transcriptional antiterminator